VTSTATNHRTVAARDIPIGAHLWVTCDLVHRWAGPAIQRVDVIDAHRVEIVTCNGGRAVRHPDEAVAICDHDMLFGDSLAGNIAKGW
jgi:hypothetical protein